MATTYAVTLIGDESIWEGLAPEEQAGVFARHEKFAAALAERGHRIVAGAELTHSRATRQIRRIDGEVTVSEGPFVETVEQIGGLYLIESDDLDDLVSLCAIITDEYGAVEVRATTTEGQS
ncbi:YciI family protein [Nocardioides sp. GXZ039]|uniref:YciI family protein n=1 Tax=Nocardioides sp. GXZ039 TaxID=3136018 RepID=UPI0030F43103